MNSSCRVGFDAGPAHSAYSGIGQYVRQLFPAMSRINSTIEWVAFTSKSQETELHGLETMAPLTVKPSKPRWHPNWMGFSDVSLDLFHGTNFKAPRHGQKKTVLTIHDLWLDRHPAYSKKLFGQKISSWKTRLGATRAEKILTVSEFSKQEIHEVFSIPLEKIAVVYHGCSTEMFPDTAESTWREVQARLGLPEGPFILFVGGAEPRKNHRVLFEAFAQCSQLINEFALVAIGNETVRGESLRQTAQALGLSKVITCPGFLSSGDLRVVYSQAAALVFPSLYEGFGIPLLEAMACGTPIITGQETALPEVAGEAALYVNVQDSEQLGVVLGQLLNDSELQERLRKKGLERVKQFTWNRAAKETLAVYQDICGS